MSDLIDRINKIPGNKIIVPNGSTKAIIKAILVMLIATTLFFFGVSFWPYKIFDKAIATAVPDNGATFNPGCPIRWSVKYVLPTELPTSHRIQLIVEYPGSDWIITYQSHEGTIHGAERDKTGRSDVIEVGTITLPRGKILENRRFKIKHIYKTQLWWRPIFQEVETPWYLSGKFDMQEDECE